MSAPRTLESKFNLSGWWGAAALGFALICHALWLNDPLDNSDHGRLTGVYGYSARAFDAMGYRELRGRPLVFFQAGVSESPIAYLNHPIWTHGLTYGAWRLIGPGEAALRVPMLIALMLTAWGVWCLGRGGGIGVAALALLSCSPLVIRQGNVVDSIPVNVACMTLATVAWMAWRDRGGAGRCGLFWMAAFLAALTDWPAAFLGLGIAADIALSSRWKGRRARVLASAALPFLVALGVNIGYLAWVLEDVSVVDHFTALAQVFDGSDAPPIGRESWDVAYVSSMLEQLRQGLGKPLLIAMGMGALAVGSRFLTRRATAADVATLILAVAGVLPLVTFWSRAATISAWLLYIAPAAGLLAAAGFGAVGTIISRLMPRQPRLVHAMGVVIFLGVAIPSGHQGVASRNEHRTDWNVEMASVLNELLEPDDVLLTTGNPGANRFYYEFTAIPSISDPDRYSIAVDHLRRAGRDRFRRVYFASSTVLWHRHAWAFDTLPMIPRSLRVLPWGEAQLKMVELRKGAIVPR